VAAGQALRKGKRRAGPLRF